MKSEFKPGVKVKARTGLIARRMLFGFDGVGEIIRWDCDGFYAVRVDGVRRIVHEEDIVLAETSATV